MRLKRLHYTAKINGVVPVLKKLILSRKTLSTMEP